MNDYESFYEARTRWLRKTPGRIKWLNGMNVFLTYIFYISYPGFMIYLFFTRNPSRYKALLIPSVSFALVSLVRRLVNRRRPYESHHLNPLIEKNTKGNSWPSRHVFSAAVIAMVFLYFDKAAGVIFLIFAFFSAIVRVAGGVHYPTDVLSGYIIGVLSGILMWFL